MQSSEKRAPQKETEKKKSVLEPHSRSIEEGVCKIERDRQIHKLVERGSESQGGKLRWKTERPGGAQAGTGKALIGEETACIEVHPLRVLAGTWRTWGTEGGGEGSSGKRIGGIVGKATKEKKRQSHKMDHGVGKWLRSEQWRGYTQSESGEESRK